MKTNTENKDVMTPTRTPFHDGGVDEGYGQINDSKGNKVARIYGSLNEVIERTNIIITAVNSHEALLKAAKIGLSCIESEEGSDHSESDFIKEAIQLAERAQI